MARLTEGFYREHLASDLWGEIRAAALKPAGYRCARCGTHGGRGGSGLQIHHLTYEHLGEELADELEVLCEDCHRAAHKRTSRRQRHRIRLANAEADRLRAQRLEDTQLRADLIGENERLHRLQRRS
jgi:5-methylcytosine-specific restriction endonuclease McrA